MHPRTCQTHHGVLYSRRFLSEEGPSGSASRSYMDMERDLMMAEADSDEDFAHSEAHISVSPSRTSFHMSADENRKFGEHATPAANSIKSSSRELAASPPPARGHRLISDVVKLHQLPWITLGPVHSEKVIGQDKARSRLRAWLSERKSSVGRSAPCVQGALLLQGPPGSGKTLLARCCTREAGFALKEYGCEMVQPLEQFLRCVGSHDCNGNKTAILIDDILEILKLPSNAGAGDCRVHCPVLCTADFVPRRQHDMFADVAFLYPLRPFEQKKLIADIGSRVRLSVEQRQEILEACRGDARQICVQSTELARSHRCIFQRDLTPSPHEFVRRLLGGTSWSGGHLLRSSQSLSCSGHELCLLQENYINAPNFSLHSAALFSSNLEVVQKVIAFLSEVLGLSS